MNKRVAIGDNSVDPALLKGIVERLENLAEEQAALADDVKDVKKEAKAKGLDVRTIERILKLRKQAAELRRMEREQLDAYLLALDME